MYEYIAVIIILLTAVNTGRCYIINENENMPLDRGTLKYPLDSAVATTSIEKNDRPVYDPGVGKQAQQKHLIYSNVD